MRTKIIIGIILFLFISAFLFKKTVENDISDLSMLLKESSKEVETLNEEIKILEDKNEELVKLEKKLEERFIYLKSDLIQNNLAYYWNYIWEDIYKSRENISKSQIDDINFLFQSDFNYKENFIVNPLNGYFASYYDDIKDIDLGKFLKYCPIGTIPAELPEIIMLSKHPNWPFVGEDNIKKLPVPIHRFEYELVQNLFSTYAGINIDELTKTDFHDLIYLENTNAYYNYTSDFGPARFRCKTVVVEGNSIKLYGNSKTDPVLTIVKIGSNYFIKSHNVM